MPELLHQQQPVLTLALDSFQDTTIDESDIRRMWILFTKCKDDIKNGFRLENISWRIWYKKYLNNTSDLFSNNKIYHKAMNNSLVHSVDSNSSNFSTIEPIEVLKKCACGEQLISSSLNSLLTPHSEYTCFNKLSCQHHHQNNSSSMDTNENINESDSLSTLVPSSIIPESSSTDPDFNSVKIFIKEEEEELEEGKVEEVKVEKEKEKIVEEKIVEKDENKIPKEIPREIPHSEMNNEKKEEDEEAKINCSNTDTTTTTTTTSNINSSNNNTIVKENQNVPNHTPISSIPSNCPTMEQFYQQQLLLLQQMYVQKQQQLQYQKQQMNVKPEQIYQQQLYLQQWFNQQQQQLLSNCSIYYKKYLIQYSQQVQAQRQAQSQGQSQVQVQSQVQQLKNESTNVNDDNYEDDGDDYEDDEDDDFYYTDDDDEDFDEDLDDVDDVDDYQDEIPVKEMNEKDIKENTKKDEDEEEDEDDLFKKISTPTLKSKLNKSSLLSAMIKENNYNEYKKTIEIIQKKYNEDARDISYNIYSIKDYNHNCINSLNKNVHRKRAPSFEDLKNAQQGYRRLLGMHPLTTIPNNNQEQTQGIINSDIEEYYERNSHHHTNTNGTNNSYSTVNTMSSQESHTTQTSGHYYGCNGVYGSNKTTHSNRSTRSTISFLTHRTTINNSISLYKNKKRLNYSN